MSTPYAQRFAHYSACAGSTRLSQPWGSAPRSAARPLRSPPISSPPTSDHPLKPEAAASAGSGSTARAAGPRPATAHRGEPTSSRRGPVRIGAALRSTANARARGGQVVNMAWRAQHRLDAAWRRLRKTPGAEPRLHHHRSDAAASFAAASPRSPPRALGTDPGARESLAADKTPEARGLARQRRAHADPAAESWPTARPDPRRRPVAARRSGRDLPSRAQRLRVLSASSTATAARSTLRRRRSDEPAGYSQYPAPENEHDHRRGPADGRTTPQTTTTTTATNTRAIAIKPLPPRQPPSHIDDDTIHLSRPSSRPCDDENKITEQESIQRLPATAASPGQSGGAGRERADIWAA